MPATFTEIESTVQRIGRKLASDRGLDSYLLIYAPIERQTRQKLCQGHTVAGGVRPVILIRVSVTDPEFERTIIAAFNQAAAVKRNGAIEVRSKLQATHESVKELFREIPSEPTPLPENRLRIQMYRRVVITDVATGLVSVQEAPEQRKGSMTYSQLIKAARRELAQLVDLYQGALRNEKAKVGQ